MSFIDLFGPLNSCAFCPLSLSNLSALPIKSARDLIEFARGLSGHGLKKPFCKFKGLGLVGRMLYGKIDPHKILWHLCLAFPDSGVFSLVLFSLCHARHTVDFLYQ